MNARALFAVAMLSLAAPAVAAGQGIGPRVSVQGALGSQINDGGDNQSLSLGFWFNERFAVLVSAERSHLPTRVEFFEDGYSISRGATTRSVSAEFRYVVITSRRISPYVIAGVGLGTSRLNVNQYFPDRVRHDRSGQGNPILIDQHVESGGESVIVYA